MNGTQGPRRPRRRLAPLGAALGLALLLAGCSLKGMAVRTLTPALDPFLAGLFAEGDLRLAEPALAVDLHLLEGLRRTRDNARLAELQAMALTGYALIFAESGPQADRERAGRLYLRARGIGIGLLGQDPFPLSEDAFRIWLEGRGPRELPGLFWSAFPYGAWMQLNLNSQEALFRLPRVEALVRHCLEIDEGYFHGSGHLFLGALDCLRPRLVGGDPERGRERFRRAAAVAGEDLLLPLLFEARYYCPATLDEERFDEIQAEAAGFDLDRRPAERLLNAWVLRELAALAGRRGELF
jgi:hypothetical protein